MVDRDEPYTQPHDIHRSGEIRRRFHSDGANHGHRYQAEMGESRETPVDHVDRDTGSSSSSVSPCIFKTPFPGLQFQEPQLVSIGPYHCNKNLPLQQYKYSLLDRFISRTKEKGKDLRFYVQCMSDLELDTRRRYCDNFSMSSSLWVEMMLLDACFIMETLDYFAQDGGSKGRVFPIEPWQLPILVRDLLILENQIPFFVLEMVFESLKESQSQEETPTLSLPTMALKFFDLAFPRSIGISCEFDHLEPDHLLDLFLHSIYPSSPIHSHRTTMVLPNFVHSFLKKINARSQSLVSTEDQQYDPPPPSYLTKNVKELQASGIELRPRIAAKFTDIDFHNGVLEIPFVTIGDLFIAILNNGVAFEHCCNRSSKDLSAYVSFMCKLIRHPTDAELLYSNGIISRFSHNDQKVVDSFHMLWMNILDLGFQHSYLSERLKELECYYTSHGNTRCWQRHLSRYWGLYLFCLVNLLFGFNHFRSVVNWMIYIVQQVKLTGVYADFQGNITCYQPLGSFIWKAVSGIAQYPYHSLRKFMDFFSLHLTMIFFVVSSSEFRSPTLEVGEKHAKEAEDQHAEVKDSITVNEMVMDYLSYDMESHDEPWRKMFEDTGFMMLVSALSR